MKKYKLLNSLIAGIIFLILFVIVGGIITVDTAKRLEEDTFSSRMSTSGNAVEAALEAKKAAEPLRETGINTIIVSITILFVVIVVLYCIHEVRKSR